MFKQGIVALTLASTSWAYADDFATGQVWGLIWDDVFCMPTPDGAQGGAWDEKTVSLSREQVFNGSGLKLTATFKDGRKLFQFWFRNKDACEAAKLNGVRTGVLNHPVSSDSETGATPPAPIAAAPKKTWYTQDLNHRSCIATRSAAEHIRDEQDSGHGVTTQDLPGGTVKVSALAADYSYYKVFTYYRTIETCTASLPSSQSIRSDYE